MHKFDGGREVQNQKGKIPGKDGKGGEVLVLGGLNHEMRRVAKEPGCGGKRALVPALQHYPELGKVKF